MILNFPSNISKYLFALIYVVFIKYRKKSPHTVIVMITTDNSFVITLVIYTEM